MTYHGKKPPNPRTVQPRKRDRKRPVTPGRYDGKNPDACCPMAAAVRSARQGRFRLARRYAAMSARLIAARVV